jgi:hypothetical protein
MTVVLLLMRTDRHGVVLGVLEQARALVLSPDELLAIVGAVGHRGSGT